MTDYHEMWEGLNIDLEAHDGLLAVLPPIFGEVIVDQKDRPARMAYFDGVFAEIHGGRIAELVAHKEKGGVVVGTFCTYVPEEIVIALGGVCIGLCGGAEVATETVESVLPRNTCALIKSSFGFKAGRICPYIECCDLVIGETTCDGKKKYYEILDLYHPTYVMELPQRKNEERPPPVARGSRRPGCPAGGVDRAEAYPGEAARKRWVSSTPSARLCCGWPRCARPRRRSSPARTLCLSIRSPSTTSRAVSPSRSTNSATNWRSAPPTVRPRGRRTLPRVLLSGCPMAIPNWKVPHIVESAGAAIVMEELCTGIRYFRNLVDDSAGSLEGLLDSIAGRYLEIDCAVFTPNTQRLDNIMQLVKDYDVAGVVYYALQFCDPYTIEAFNIRKAMEEAGVPFLYIETDYSSEDTGQISTRVEAFLEMLNAKQ